MTPFNAIIDQKVITDAAAEPVSLADVKAYMKVDYGDDDFLITSLIKAARRLLEQRYDVGIVEKTLQIIVNNSCGGRDLPGAPITEIVSVKDRDEQDISAKIIGDHDRFIECPVTDYLKIQYKSGYQADAVPDQYKTAIMAQVLWMYERRGDQDIAGKVAPQAAAIMRAYRRNSMGMFL
jgi:hypothetical protein